MTTHIHIHASLPSKAKDAVFQCGYKKYGASNKFQAVIRKDGEIVWRSERLFEQAAKAALEASRQMRTHGVQDSSFTVRNTAPDVWRVFENGKSVSVAGPFKTSTEASNWVKAHAGKDSAQRTTKKYTSEYLMRQDIAAMKKAGWQVASQQRNDTGDFEVTYFKE